MNTNWWVRVTYWALAFLFIDTLFLAGLEFGFPWEKPDLYWGRRAGHLLISHYTNEVQESQLQGDQALLRSLESLSEQVSSVRNSLALVKAVENVYALMEAINEKEQERKRDILLEIVRTDPLVMNSGPEEKRVVFTGNPVSGKIEAAGDHSVISSGTMELLNSTPELADYLQSVEIVVVNGSALPAAPVSPFEQLAALREEASRLRDTLREVERRTGMTKTVGEGVLIEASDAPRGYLWSEIVHERDIRDIVNSLFEAGAEGVEIGGERFGAASWVRCVGPVVVVNGRAVAANPIVVKAVGDPDKLAASVRHVEEIFAATGKRLDVSKKREITLVPVRNDVGGGDES